MIIREIYIIKIKKYQVKFDIYYMLAGINDERGFTLSHTISQYHLMILYHYGSRSFSIFWL
jgi:hypothetical protein